MRLILLVLMVLSIILAKWVGIGTTWLLTPIATNNYGSIILTFILIYTLFEVLGINKLNIFHIKKDGK